MTSVVNERFEQIRKAVESTPAKKLTETLINDGLTSDQILEAIFAKYRESFASERAKDEFGKFEFQLTTLPSALAWSS